MASAAEGADPGAKEGAGKEAEAEAKEGAAAKEEASAPKVREGSLLLILTWAFDSLIAFLCVRVQRRKEGVGKEAEAEAKEGAAGKEEASAPKVRDHCCP